jgi:protein SCO1/2
MKATAVLTVLFLATASLMLAAETPAAAPAAKDACCAEKPVEQTATCCAAAAPAAKPCGCACCAEKPAAGKDACCAEKAAPKPEAACCKPETPAAGDFTKESLYQLEVTFTDDTGRTVALGELRGRPVVLDMFFASCGYACPLTVTDMLAIQERLPAALRAQAVFVLVSFDVARDTTEVLAKYRTLRGLDGRWVLLRGSEDSVRELAALLGVKYKQEADGMFSHSNIVTILNRQGEIVHQRQGLKGGLDEATAAIVAVK